MHGIAKQTLFLNSLVAFCRLAVFGDPFNKGMLVRINHILPGHKAN